MTLKCVPAGFITLKCPLETLPSCCVGVVWSCEQGEAGGLKQAPVPHRLSVCLRLSGELRSQRSTMDLSDALGDWPSGGNQSAGGGPWPGQPNNPTWPGQPPAANPTWPGGPSGGGGVWPGGNPSQPTWPSPSPQPAAPGGWPSPSPGPGPGPGPTHPTAPQQNLAVPYQQNLPSGVYDKLLITIAGTVKPNADKITVDMSTANDLAFHFNPRFNESGRKVIVRNSCIGKKWGKEERDLQHFPFVHGQPFEMKILCTSREFKVAVNNSHLLEFKHRITDLRSINKLNIYYDLNLSKVHMETLA
ncbi:galectin-3-like [Seriola dumerili]|uniref:Galectin n=1 Tax=Seriola dumerili TaxID=41447 RepID=A0A3B4T1S6_SERDU|nr:galectin-3-like [Seriola dumerili]